MDLNIDYADITIDDADTAPDKWTPSPVSVPEPPAVKVQPKPTLGVYPPPAEKPTQNGPLGIRFDFNLGCRVLLPDGDWKVRLRDLDTGNLLYETAAKAVLVNSRKRYYLRCGIEVLQD